MTDDRQRLTTGDWKNWVALLLCPWCCKIWAKLFISLQPLGIFELCLLQWIVMSLKFMEIILVWRNVRWLCSRNEAVSTGSKIHSVAKLSIKGSTFHTFVHPPTTITVAALLSLGNYFNTLGKCCDFLSDLVDLKLKAGGALSCCLITLQVQAFLSEPSLSHFSCKKIKLYICMY